MSRATQYLSALLQPNGSATWRTGDQEVGHEARVKRDRPNAQHGMFGDS